MKKSVLIKSVLVLSVLIFVAKMSFAGVNDPKSGNELKQIISKNVSYPSYAKENLLEGFAVVAFKIDKDGKVHVEQVSASAPCFKEYVETKLNKMQLPDASKYDGQTIYYRFTFKLIDNN